MIACNFDICRPIFKKKFTNRSSIKFVTKVTTVLLHYHVKC